jgi:hypothetical protein
VKKKRKEEERERGGRKWFGSGRESRYSIGIGIDQVWYTVVI